MPGTLHKHKSYDSIVGKISEKSKKQKLRALQNSTKKQETNGLPTILHLKIGIKYMVTVNIDIEDGLVNGVTGLLKHILFDDSKEPKVLYLEFESARIGQKAIRENKNDLNHNAFDKICDKWVPLREITLEISNANKSAYFQTYRRQFPISPAEAITIHKSQGSTFETICVDTREKLSRQLLYVALSRVTKLKNLYIIGKFQAPGAPNAQDDTMVEINRLKTIKGLNLCFNSLEQKNGLTIGYQNVLSFKKYRAHIENDTWYKQCDVLVLAETQTVPNDEPNLSSFKLVDRFDVKRTIGTRGILIFAKPWIQLNFIFGNITYSRKDTKQSKGKKKNPYHAEVYAYEVCGMSVITGYKSPLTPNGDFEELLSSALAAIKGKGIQKQVFLGDFNFDLLRSGKGLTATLSKFGMSSKLEPEEITTKNNTQIDVVFANFQNIVAGVYDSYFSDHYPIFCMCLDDQKAKPKANLTSYESGKKNLSKNENIIEETKEIITSPCRNLCFPVENVSDSNDESLRLDKDNPLELIRIARENMDMISEIRDINQRLTNFTVDYFLEELVKQQFPTYMMQPTVFAQAVKHYQPAPSDFDDIQIVLSDDHYVVTFSKAQSNEVFVYDSLYKHRKQLTESQLNILRKFYPGKRYIFKRPATLQPDWDSCGVFAIAYVTTLLFGLDPCTYTLGSKPHDKSLLILLRAHLEKIINSKVIEPFPSYGTFD